MSWSRLEPWYARAALHYYNDFGHAAIYVYKTGTLLNRLGHAHAQHVILPLTRMLCYTTRDDLLPDFQPYAEHLARVPESPGTSSNTLEAAFAMSTKDALAWTVEQMSTHAPVAIYSALLDVNALNLLRFDESHSFAAKRTVSQNVGWLNFTHAFTFGNAVRNLCARNPELWPHALLQMACFVGRNKRFVERDADVSPWLVEDERAFFADAQEQILDHGVAEPIFSAHLLKTTMAVEQELPHVASSCRGHLLAALNRFLKARIKEKHALRTARQALALAQASI